MLTARVIRTLEEFACLQEAWDALLLRSPRATPFLSFPWLAQWLKLWSSETANRIIAVFDGKDRLVAGAAFCILPLQQLPWPVKALQFAGAAFTDADYLDVLCEPGCEEQAAAVIADQLVRCRRDWNLIELANVEEGRAKASPLQAALKVSGLTCCTLPGCVCPYAELPPSFEEFLGTLRASHRANFRRGHRVLSNQGRLGFRVFAERSEIGSAYAELVRLHRLRFEDRRQASAFLAERVQIFHTRVVPELAKRGWVRVLLLTLDDQPIAGLYGFQIGKTFWYFQGGMDPAVARASAGVVCLGLTMDEAIRQGCTTYDFLRGNEPYKLLWAQQARRTASAYFHDGRPWAACTMTALRLRSALKTFIRKRVLAREA